MSKFYNKGNIYGSFFRRIYSFRKVFLLLALTGLHGISLSQPVPAADWEYSRIIGLSPATSLADYQVRVALSPGQYGGMNIDGSDLRFYDNTNAVCSYWIEKWNNSGTSVIWVKVPTNGATSLTMYYGNPSATSLSDGNTTFDFFDDFLGSALNSNWATNTTGGSINVSGGEAILFNNNWGRVVLASTFTTFSPSFVLETKHEETNYYRNRFYATDKVVDLNSNQNTPTEWWDDYGYFSDAPGSSTGYCYPVLNGVIANTDYLTSWNITDGSTYIWSTFDYETGNLVYSQSKDVAANVRNIVIAVTESPNSTTSVDWVRVRKSTGGADINTSIGSQVQITPTISSFTPGAECAGGSKTITITGTNLDNVSAVTFNGVNASSFTHVSRTQITAVTSTSNTTGKISVTTPGGTAISAGDLIINALPTQFTVGGGGGYCEGSAGLNITLSGSQNNINYQLIKDGSPVGSPISGTGSSLTFPLITAAGYYTISAQDNVTGCPQNMTGSATIVINTVNKYDVTGTGNYCSGGPGLPIGLSNSDAGVSYQLLLGGAPAGSPVPGAGGTISFGNHTAGTYTVKATNTTTSCFEMMNGSAVIGLLTSPSGTLSASENSGVAPNDNKICIGENITFNATSGYSNYLFKIDGVSIQTGSSSSFINPNSPLTAGTRSITVDVTSADGCMVTFNPISLIVSNLPTATLTSSTNNICPGVPVTFTASGGSTYTFYVNGSVMRPASPIASYSSSTLNNGDVVTAGVTNGNGCTSVTSGITMIVKPLPANAGSISGSATVCQGQNNVTYSVTPITDATSYSWTLPAGATIISGAGTPSIIVNYSTTAVTGDIIVAGTNGCGNGVSKNLYVTVNPLPVDAGSISGSAIVCQGQTGVTYTVPGITHATGYVWTLPTGYSIVSGANTNSISVNFSNTAASGNISVKGTNACGNGASSSFSVAVNPLPGAAGNITGTATLCQGSAGIAYHVPAIANASSYTWAYTGTGITLNNGSTKDITIDFSNAATSGVLTVIGNNACGAGIVSANYNITVNPLPTATVALDAHATVCKNSTILPGVIFTGANGTAPYTFSYTINGVAQPDKISSGNSITIFAPTNVSGTFTYNLVSVKDATSTHCSNPQTGSVSVTINPLPEPVLTGPAQICPDQTLDYSTQSGNGIHNYTWTITNGSSISGGSSADNTVKVHWANDNSAKSIYVNYEDANGCAGNTSVSVISSLPTTPVITGVNTVCLNSTEIEYQTQGGFTDYNWSITGGTITSGGNSNTVHVTWSATGPQSISVNFNSGTCSAPAPTTYPVTVNPLPTATVATNNASVCQNGTSPVVTFTGSNGVAPYTFSYTINGVAQPDVTSSGNSKTVTVPTGTPGNYVYKLVSVKGNNTCAQSQTDEVTVTVNTLPTATISGATIVCQNSPQPSITFTGSNGTAPYTFTYKINSGSNQTVVTTSGNSITVPVATNATGNFTYSIISVADVKGCGQAVTGQNAIVTVKVLPTATIAGPDSVCLNNSASITITGADGTAPYTFVYNINGGANISAASTGSNAIIPVTTSVAGPFQFNLVSVQEASSNTCMQNQTGSWTIIVSPATVGGTVNGSTAICTGGSGSLNLSGQTGKIIKWQSSTDGTTWNDISNTSSTLNYSGLLATTQYRAVVKSGFCGIEYSTAATITVNEAVGGTVSGSATVCGGSNGTLQLSGNTGAVQYWQYSTDNGANWTITSNTTATLPYTNISQPTWYRAVSKNDPCSLAYSDIAKINVNVRPNGTISGNAAICDGLSTTLTLELNGTGPFTGTLSDGTAFNRSASGTSTLTVTPNTSTSYTIATLNDANCTNDYSDKYGMATITVNPVPVPPIIKPGNSTICEGGILPLTSVLNDVTNGSINTTHAVNKTIPDNDIVTGVSDAITVSGIPIGAIVDSVAVNFNVTHPEVFDVKLNLKAPNGKIITLVSNVSGTNMTNTTINSNVGIYPVVGSQSAPYTGIFQADGEGTFAAQFGDANTRSFATLFGTTATPPNGNWVLTTYDAGGGDVGTLDNWTLSVYYHVPIQPVEIVWSPLTGLYTDPAATTSYTGTALSTVYAKPTATTTYTGTATSSASCTSSSQVTVTVKPAPVVTVKADYCAVPGFVQLKATSVPEATSYTWSTGATGNVALVDEAKLYVVSAQIDGCAGTGLMSVAQELVKNGDFEAGYIPGGFTTQYGYVTDVPGVQTELYPEGLFAIDTSANNFHDNFFGKDHTTSAQTGKFMIINGYPNATTKIIWQQTVTVLPNTNYYYSAWAMNLNDAGVGSPFARLQFEVNGVPIGTIADLSAAPKPTNPSEVNINNWVRFYYGNTNGWESGSNTTAIIRIIDLNPELGGNDFGLDDISFATLSTFITKTSSPTSDNQTVCKNGSINKITYTVGSGGDGPLITGLPRGVTSTFNGITFTISGAPDTVGVFTYTITTQGSCNPATATGTITVTGQTISKPTDGTDAQTICINTSIAPIKYYYGGTATDADVSDLPQGMSFSKDGSTKLITIYGSPSQPGLFTYKVFTTQGTCGHDTVTGTINVNIQTINKTPESDTAQVICKGSPITSILYELKGTATGANVTGLPAGLSGLYNPGTGIYTISGTPTVASGLYHYTVTTTGSCAAAAAIGTIEIVPDATISLVSGTGTDNQKLCFNSGSIAEIKYQIITATGATVNGLPSGLTGSYESGIFTIKGTPAVTGVFNYTVQTTGTCTQTSISGIVTIDPEVSGGNLTYSYSATCSPATGVITLSGETGAVTGWEFSTNGSSWTPVTNTSHSQNFSVVNTTYYRAKIDGASCGAALSNAVLVGVHNLWTGNTSTDWNDGTNWSDGNIPSVACPNVVIPGGTPRQPTLGSGMATINNLQIQAGATLTINNNANLQIAGAISNLGVFDAKGGTVELNGTSSQSIGGAIFKNSALNNLIVSNSSSQGITVTSPLDIYRSVTFGAAGNKLATGGYLTLKSTVTETAWLGNMTGKTLEGDVTVERYINVGNGGSYHGKSWQLVATPTVGQTVRQSWMENGSTLSTGYGTQIIGPGGTAKGFDNYTTNLPSLKYYDHNTNNWIGIDNTGLQVYDQRGYLLFVRGDRSVSFPNTGNTTLRTKGTLFTPANPPPTTTVYADEFESIGNPYASAIDLTRITLNGGVAKSFSVWDPELGDAYGLGGYQTLSQTKLYLGDNNFYAMPGGGSYGSDPNNFIQSGQAFFAQATGSNGTVSFSENSKSGGSKLLFRGGLPAIQGPFAQIQADLYGVNPDGSISVKDGNLIQYNSEYSDRMDGLDARKLPNAVENFGILSTGKDLAIERRNKINESDTVRYHITGLKNQNYQMALTVAGLSDYGYQGYIEDDYLQTKTLLPSDGKIEINFEITNAVASKSADRFKIVFKYLAPLPETFVSVKAQQKDTNVEVDWKAENENGMQQYDVEKSTDGVRFVKSATVKAVNKGAGSYQWTDREATSGSNYYRIKSISSNGRIEYSTIVKVLVISGESIINIYPNPITDGIIHLRLMNQPKGMYGIRLLNPLGQVIVAKQANHAGGNGTENIKWDYNLAHGVYQLEVTKPDGTVTVIKVMY